MDTVLLFLVLVLIVRVYLAVCTARIAANARPWERKDD